MSQSTASIRYLKDKDDEVFFPVAHEKGVVDSNGTTLETKLGQKQDTLVSGTNIKTVNNQSIVGSGNITIDSGSDIDTVSVSVDNNTGTPSATGSVSGSTLTLSFTNLKGAKGDTGATGATGATGPQGPKGDQGNPGSSVDYAFTLANNLTTTDSTVALAAPQGKALDDKISQLAEDVNGYGIDESSIAFDDPTWTWGQYCDTGGTLTNSTYWGRKAFPLKAGQEIVVKTQGSGAAIIAEDTGATKLTVLVTAISAGQSAIQTYTYTPSTDKEVIVFIRHNATDAAPSVYAAVVGGLKRASGIDYDDTVTELGAATVQAAIEAVDAKFTGRFVPFTPTWGHDEYYINTSGVLTASSTWATSSPIYLKKGDAIIVQATGTSVAVISKTDASGSSYTPVVNIAANKTQYSYFNAIEDGYYAICSDIHRDSERYFQKYVYSEVPASGIDLSSSAAETGYVSPGGDIGSGSTNRIIRITNDGYTHIRCKARMSTGGCVIALYNSTTPSSSTLMYGITGDGNYSDFLVPVMPGVKLIIYGNTPSYGDNNVMVYKPNMEVTVPVKQQLGDSAEPISQGIVTQYVRQINQVHLNSAIFLQQEGVHQANTAAAMDAAIAAGKKYIETDVAITSDNICVIKHADLSNVTYAEALANDPSLMTLKAALVKFKAAGVIMELDMVSRFATAAQVKVAIDTCQAQGMRHSAVFCLSWGQITAARDYLAGCMVCHENTGVTSTLLQHLSSIMDICPVIFISRDAPGLGEQEVIDAHSAGIYVRTYQNPSDTTTLKNWGVDVLIM